MEWNDPENASIATPGADALGELDVLLVDGRDVEPAEWIEAIAIGHWYMPAYSILANSRSSGVSMSTDSIRLSSYGDFHLWLCSFRFS